MTCIPDHVALAGVISWNAVLALALVTTWLVWPRQPGAADADDHSPTVPYDWETQGI